MDNRTKRYISTLEARIHRLENIMEGVISGINANSSIVLSCNQCGAYDPASSDYVCSQPDCCQGLNPKDDETN